MFVTMKQLCFGFDDASNFTLYSKTFPPFAMMMFSTMFLNGGYNLSFNLFPWSSTTLSQPFFLCSFNFILEFFLQLQYTHIHSFLSF